MNELIGKKCVLEVLRERTLALHFHRWVDKIGVPKDRGRTPNHGSLLDVFLSLIGFHVLGQLRTHFPFSWF